MEPLNNTIYFNPKTSKFVWLIKVPQIDHIDYSSDDDFDYEGIYYEDFVANNMQVQEIEGGNDIVIEANYIHIFFDTPCFSDQPTFTITTDNETIGFTRKELILKVMQLFHMLYYLYKNYDMENGTITTNDISYDKKCFRPLLADYDYNDNGVVGLKYDKLYNRWNVLMINYH